MIIKLTDRKGFTVIELIVVITVLSILAGIVYGVYGNQRQKTAASTMYTDFKTIELAIESFARADGISEWWPQSQFGSSGSTDNPSITNIQSSTDLKRYLATVPETSVDSTSGYSYDNDAEYSSVDSYNPTSCGSSDDNDGVNLALTVDSSDAQAKKIFEIIDDKQDDGDASCGKITEKSASGKRTLYYHFAINKDDYPSSID